MAEQDDEAVKLALLAHDLRTPLAAMSLTAELIGNEALSSTQSEHLSVLIRSIDALSGMTAELIGQAGPGSATQAEAGSVTDLVADVCDLFQVAADAKGLTLKTSIQEEARPLVSANTASLRRILTTLLDNAIKYTASGTVIVDLAVSTDNGSANPAGDQVRLSVTDTGPGIDPEEAARLFRPFIRGRQGRAAGPGSGLGLWGTKLLVQDMNGHIHLETPPEGGSRFIVEFPAGARAGETPAVPADPGGDTTVQSALRAMHVLVVDDNETNCRLLAALLESFGVTADIAGSGLQAIALAEKGAYDAVLLDLHMPEMSGAETAKRLRQTHGAEDLPLIAVTAALETAEETGLGALGFQDMLTKPLSPAALYDALERVRQ